MIYEIFEGNMERLRSKLLRIENKCKKYDCEFTFNELGEVFKEVKDKNGNKIIAKFYKVEVEGLAKKNNWEFCATIEHTEHGNIIRNMSQYEIPLKYHNGKPICEHCNSNRIRKDTYIVRNTITGEFKQVGKTCLQDFTHGLSTEMAACRISLYDSIIEGENVDKFDSSCYKRYIPIDEALTYIAETIRIYGFIPSKEKNSTKEKSYLFYTAENIGLPSFLQKDIIREMHSVDFRAYTEQNIALVKSAREWAINIEEQNNYMMNLKIACSLKYIEEKDWGIISSLFVVYDKALKKNKTNSDYVGNISERITINVNSIKAITGWETDFGYTYLYQIIDNYDNVLIWKTTKQLNVDNINMITGTIKEHKLYNNIKQTILTRCRV